MVVGNLTITDESQVNQYHINNLISSNFDALSMVRNENFFLNGEKFAELRSLTNFTSVRMFCEKEWHGRRVDIKFLGEAVDRLTWAASSNDGFCNNNYAFLEGDTSLFQNGGYTCASYGGMSESIDTRLYAWAFYVEGIHNVRGMHPHCCDDAHINDAPNFTIIGKWVYYIR